MNQNYVDTVQLLLAIAPTVFASGRFAMKGGTALNLFVQETPRLSVDIDVVFVDHRLERDAAVKAIALELAHVQRELAGKGYRTRSRPKPKVTTSSCSSATVPRRSRSK